jgi:hypothetical protein
MSDRRDAFEDAIERAADEAAQRKASKLTAKLIGQDTMHELRDELAEKHQDVLAVIVLSGSESTGLAMSVSSYLSERETIELLLSAALAEPQ